MNPGIEYYRPFGNQAYVILNVLKVPLAGHVITIEGVTFTFGTDYTGNNEAEVAENLTAAINGDRTHFGRGSAHLRPSLPFFAYYSGKRIIVVASQPGTAGNAYTAATSDATYIGRNSATFQGGTDSSVTLTGTAGALPAATALTKRTPTLATATLAVTATPQAIAGVATKYTKVHLITPSTNAADILLGTAASQAIPLNAAGWFAFDPPPGTVGDLNDLYIKGTAGDVVYVFYWN